MKPTIFKKSALYVALLAAAPIAFAADEADDGANDEVVQIIGSRSQKVRTVADSTVPVDIISSDELSAMGSTADLTDNLKALIPSYSAPPATGDGSAFVRAATLRGTSPDQTLILVDGKRRHRSALIQFFAPAGGNGSHAADVGMIPASAIKRIEVLRDGAASQYGSDAIAGVINFVMKDADDGGDVSFQYGQFFEGESSTKFDLNKGVKVGDTGFLNFSMNYTDNEALSRGIQHPNAQALIDAQGPGYQNIGSDSPFGDSPLAMTWGRVETSGVRMFLNSGFDLGEGQKAYGRFSYADADGTYRFFYRTPVNDLGLSPRPVLATLDGLGLTGHLSEAGFTPFLDNTQSDYSAVGGVEGELSNGTYYDFSASYGFNEQDYYLNNTVNGSLGLGADTNLSTRGFDIGALQQTEVNLNADFSKLVTDNINVAYGFEWREETYTVVAGEPDSYLGTGSDGFGGFKPENSGEFSRDNTAVYIDIEQDISYDLLMQYALRYEDYSDFGGTVNGKVAGRYSLNDNTAIRGAISTGFHAPSPGQSNIQKVITDSVGGVLVESGLVPPTHPSVAASGGKPLTEETSLNLSLGVTTNLGDDTTLTVDAYKIAVEGRIYRTGDIPNLANPGTTLSFYTNAMDLDHFGLDVVLSSQFEWNADVATDIALAYSYNEVDYVDQTEINGVSPVSAALIEDIEKANPKNRFVLTTNTPITDDLTMMIRGNYYGEHRSEEGRLNVSDMLISSTLFVDIEFRYMVTPELKLSFGGSNIFDEFPDKLATPSAGRLYPRRTPVNFEGGSWYIGASYSFE